VTALIELQDVQRSYFVGQQIQALAGISLTIRRGEYVAVTGPSGSGKSTLLNLLGCLDRPSAGSYRLDGRDVSGMDDRQLSLTRGRLIGFVFQSFNLLERLTVQENIEVPMLYMGTRWSLRRSRSRMLAQRVGIADRLRHLPSQLSGGQQQRVAIARAIANDPPIILADEPTGNLDTNTSREILALFEQLNADGCTLIMVTHDESLARRARRRVHLCDGRLTAAPEPAVEAAP
jgi:putative ABC transport system ATP-binding protein